MTAGKFCKGEEKKEEKELASKMLPQIHRLKKKNDFERVYKKGQGFRKDFLFLKCAANDSNVSRIGIVVSKKVASKATDRNLIKRRIRGAVKEMLLVIRPGQDIIISALIGIDKLTDFQSIKETLYNLLLKSGIINEQ